MFDTSGRCRHYVTFVSAYFNNATMLRRQVEELGKLPADWQAHIELIVVDDASDTAPAALPEEWFEQYAWMFRLRIYRLTRKVRWNQDACRNLGAVVASPDNWLLLTDMDHIPTKSAWQWMLFGAHETSKVYRFGRQNYDGSPYKPHPNSWFMTQDMYDTIGGYDERLAGLYGTDGDFRKRVDAHAAVIGRPETLIRVGREDIPDASTPRDYGRKSEEDKTEMSRRVQERDAQVLLGLGPRTQRLTFPWVKVH